MGTFKPASSWTQRLFLCVIKELPTGPQLRHKQTALCGYLNPCNFSFNTLTSVKSPAVTHSVGLVKRSHFLNKKTHNTYRNMADKFDLLVRYIGVLLLRAGQHYNKDANVCTHVGLCVFSLKHTHNPLLLLHCQRQESASVSVGVLRAVERLPASVFDR